MARVAKNPMKRALRLDKIRLAALEAVLKLYRDPDRLPQILPTLRYFTRSRSELAAAAARLSPDVAAAVGTCFAVSVVECTSQIGSGALPLETLQSAGLAIGPSSARVAALASRPCLPPSAVSAIPVIGRVKDGALILDLRCLDDEAGFATQLGLLGALLARGEAPDVPE